MLDMIYFIIQVWKNSSLESYLTIWSLKHKWLLVCCDFKTLFLFVYRVRWMWRGILRDAAHWGSTLASCITSRAEFPWDQARRLAYPSHGSNTRANAAQLTSTDLKLIVVFQLLSFALDVSAPHMLTMYSSLQILQIVNRTPWHLYIFKKSHLGLKSSLEKRSPMMTSATSKHAFSTILVSK